MNLREYLEEYRDLTLKIIDEVKKDGQISPSIDKREEIIKAVNIQDFDKEEIKTIVKLLNLEKLEEELQILYKKEMVEVKRQIDNIKKAKQININYNNIENIARVFNKTI